MGAILDQLRKYNANHGPDGKFTSGEAPGKETEPKKPADVTAKPSPGSELIKDPIPSTGVPAGGYDGGPSSFALGGPSGYELPAGKPLGTFSQRQGGGYDGEDETEKPVTPELVKKHLDMISDEMDAAYDNGDISNEDYEDRLAVLEHLKQKAYEADLAARVQQRRG